MSTAGGPYFSGIRPVGDQAPGWNLYHGMICLTLLKGPERRVAWDCIKTQAPDLAAMLSGEDPVFKGLQEAFGPLRIWVKEEHCRPANPPATDGAP